MNELNPGSAFRGLPLTPEQESEVEHYIHIRTRQGLAWDTPELRAMIADMLNPPEVNDDELSDDDMAGERNTASGEESADLEQLQRDRGHNRPL